MVSPPFGRVPFSSRWRAKIVLVAILPISIGRLRSRHPAQGSQREAAGMALVENVSIINSPVDQTTIQRTGTSDAGGEGWGVRLQNVTYELAFAGVHGIFEPADYPLHACEL